MNDGSRLHNDNGLYPRESFSREDESDDNIFYSVPRLLVHLDQSGIAAVKGYLGSVLPQDGVILDLMSSWRSHLPEGFSKRRLVGLGMNDVEMGENYQLDEWHVHDLNLNPTLPFRNDSFDAAVVTVSVQYLATPVEVFSDVYRVLRMGASFHVIYSNRMFPTKAVSLWRSLDGHGRACLVMSYFSNSGVWEGTKVVDISQESGPYFDSVFVVSSKKSTDKSEERLL